MTATPASAAQRTDRSGPRSAILVTAAAALVAGSLLTGTGRADARAAAPTQLAATSKPGPTKPAANDEADDFKFPGLDTLALPGGSQRYISYGASAAGRQVPFTIHGQGADASPSAKIDGDALPGGGGKGTKGGGIWAPAAYYHPGTHRYYLFYTASKAGSVDRKCIGVASSASPTKDFRAADGSLVCPTKGTRWALDADVVQGPEGAVWMVWRDGQRAIGAQSAISAMMLKFGDNGGVTGGSEPRVILRTDHLPWTDNGDGKGVVVAENPAALFHQGSWYLMYSGNSWPTNKYATGIAYCGMSLADDVCTPITRSGPVVLRL